MATFSRSALQAFEVGNPIYAGSVWQAVTVDVNGNPTTTLATLYADLTSTAVLPNPQTMDGTGAFPVPVYANVPVILQQISNPNGIPNHSTGVISANLAGSAASDAAASAVSAAGFFGATADILSRTKSVYAKFLKLGFPVSLVGKALSFVRVNAGESAFEFRTPTQTRGDIGFGASLTAVLTKAPTRTSITSGSGTYTTPAGATRLNVRMVGGGAGGGGGNSGGSGNAGGTTTFNAFTANGGAAGAGNPGNGVPVGGTASGGTVNAIGAPGATGGISTATFSSVGGQGGSTIFGGGAVGQYAANGNSATANTGAGGAGGGADGVNALAAGNGGGAGGYLEGTITSPAATYAYAVGVGGLGVNGGVSGHVSGGGGSGLIIVDEFYN